MPYYSRKTPSGGGVLIGIWRGFSMSFAEKKEGILKKIKKKDIVFI